MRLSVCIPVYNVAAYVETCARSLFAQTYPDIEYIFVDDCTPDDSIAIVRRVLAEFPQRAAQVRFLRHETNRGLIAARKTAIRAATGEFLAHCDSDDWLEADFYEKLIRRLEETDADMVLASSRRHLPSRTLEVRVPPETVLDGKSALARLDELPALTAMMPKVMRRAIVDLDALEWPDSIMICEDYCHMVQLLPRCRRVATAPDAFYNYRVNANSMTRSRNVRRLVEHHARVYEILMRRVPGKEGVPARRNLVRPILYWGIVHGLLSAAEFRRWRSVYERLGGRYDFTDMSLWGQRMMKLAKISVPVARLVAPLVRRKVDDCL